MVKRSIKGQSTMEFVVILTALTAIGMFIAWKMWPTTGGTGAIATVQTNAVDKIGKD